MTAESSQLMAVPRQLARLWLLFAPGQLRTISSTISHNHSHVQRMRSPEAPPTLTA
jgi:hypothetical protein